jgi:DNA-binding FadR family transcriptional regulator
MTSSRPRTYPRRGLHGALVHNIGLQIVSGDVEPGAALPEEQLSRTFEVSRTVLREVIKVLAAKGLVESRPKTGTRVCPRHQWNLLDPDVIAWRIEAQPDRAFMMEIFGIRRLIETAAARFAAGRITDDDLVDLQRWYDKMAHSTADVEAYVAADLGFHSTIYRACGSELLAYMGEMLRGAFRTIFTLTTELPGASVAALPLHHDVLKAIVARDPDAAERAALVLIDRSAAFHEGELAAAAPADRAR